MMGHVPHLHLPPPWGGQVLALSSSQRHHLERVLRLREDDPISYTDGSGTIGAGRLADGSVLRGEETDRQPPSSLTVAVAPPRSRDRARFLVEKLAELAVTRLVWVETRRGEGRPPPADKAGTWVTSALEQSRGAWAMGIEEAAGPDSLDPSDLVVAVREGEPVVPTGRRTLLIGPEGGLEQGEIPAGVPHVSLASTVLRVETAAIVGAALLRGANEGPSPRLTG